MSGHVEPLAAVLRIGGGYGEPYTWAATLRYLSPGEVEVMGATRAPSPDERRAIRAVLRSNGVHKAFYIRRLGDETRRIELIR